PRRTSASVSAMPFEKREERIDEIETGSVDDGRGTWDGNGSRSGRRLEDHNQRDEERRSGCDEKRGEDLDGESSRDRSEEGTGKRHQQRAGARERKAHLLLRHQDFEIRSHRGQR